MQILEHEGDKKETQRERDKWNDIECILLKTNWEELRELENWGEKALRKGGLKSFE